MHQSSQALPMDHSSTASLPSRSDSPAAVVCDLAQSGAYSHSYNKPHAPILVAFGGDRLHQCGMPGSWDLERAVSENSEALFRSIRRLPGEARTKQWDDLTFQFGPRSFLYVDDTRIVGFAETPAEAERLVTEFNDSYRTPPIPTGGTFHLIKTGREISFETVPLSADTVLSDETFELHYGAAGRNWHTDFSGKVRANHRGLSLLEGTPGTGKTSYLRHLMGTLKESHRFYFIPPATMGVLSNPEFIGFWAEERRHHSDRKFVVILEDCDAALMSRGPENSEQVSAILNLSDGMLADFLRLQIICTINCRATEIDQALLRPGRLLCHRIFPRLDYADACRLAASLGQTLPEESDYSLAEVFAGKEVQEIRRPRIGFGA